MSKILIADDEAVMRKMLQVILEKAGYSVISAVDGIDALEKLKSEHHVCLAVIDWMMPRLDGLELCRRLHQSQNGKPVYVIILTAQEGATSIEAAFEAGANDYIRKPFNREELLSRVKVGERTVELQMQLTQAQKLESIGQLAAGIAHEINTPTQFVSDNVLFLQDSFEQLVKVHEAYARLLKESKSNSLSKELVEEVNAIVCDSDIEYLFQEIPLALEQSKEGLARIADIVRAMRTFACPNAAEKTVIDINKAIEHTITISTSEWKYVAELKKDFESNLSGLQCYPGQFNQIILNLIINAAHAIAASAKQDLKGTISVSTKHDGDWVEIRVSDNGTGISREISHRIFDPFFTTKELGKGTGQGLSICHNIVVKQHGGTIDFESEAGKGSTFIVRLPYAANTEKTEDLEKADS